MPHVISPLFGLWKESRHDATILGAIQKFSSDVCVALMKGRLQSIVKSKGRGSVQI